MSEFATTPPIPYVPIGDQASAVRSAINVYSKLETYSQAEVDSFFFNRAPDADVTAYITAVETALGTTIEAALPYAINPKHKIYNFVTAEKAASRWALHKRIYLPIYNNAAASAIDMVSRTNGTFQGVGVTHAAGYVQGDGTSGSFLLNANLPTMGVGHTNISAGGLCYIAPSSNNSTLFSAFDSVSQVVDVFHSSSVTLVSRVGVLAVGGEATITTTNFAGHRGVILSSYNGSSRFLKIRRSSGIITGTGSSTAVGATPTATPRFMADSRNSNWSNAGYGAFYISSAMTSSDADGFITAIETLWESLTGLTLP